MSVSDGLPDFDQLVGLPNSIVELLHVLPAAAALDGAFASILLESLHDCSGKDRSAGTVAPALRGKVSALGAMSLATIGTAQDIASKMTRAWPSQRLGTTARSASWNQHAGSGDAPANTTFAPR